ncbi:hypothetical protein D3C80_1686100 [compost metagenome]
MVAKTRTLLVSTFFSSTSLSQTEALSTPASARPAATKATVASWAPENATFLKSFSGFRPASCRKKRGIRLPEVDEGAPKAKVLPLRSARPVICGLAVMNLDVNLASSSRWTMGMAVPLVRILACTKVKPPSQARSILRVASDSTTAA